MDINYADFEDKIVKKLKESQLFDHFPKSPILESPDLSIIIKAFEIPSLIHFDDQGLFFFDEDETKIYCPEMLTSISEKGEWLSDKLPYVDFDIDQNGNVRKAEEAESLYCAIIVANCIQDNYFKEEIISIANGYDFANMKPIDDKSNNFKELLNEWQSLQSVTVNVLISAAKYRISDVKKDIEKFLRDGISDIQAAELRELERIINSINDEYSKGVLSPDSVKLLTKSERLQQIDKRDNEISAAKKKSKAGILYELLKLSSEYISPVKKKKISLWVRFEVDKLLEENPSFTNLREERSQIISRFQKRAIKMEKNSVRKSQIEKYINQGENFKFPAKM